MSLATQFDLTRKEIIERYKQRIQKGERTKLTKDELAQLTLHFVDRLKSLNSEAEIKALCEAEIAFLEEGYPQATIAGNQLPLYRKHIKEAIDKGELPLTDGNSHLVTWTKRNIGEPGQTQEHFALTHLKYDQATYQQIRGKGTVANNTRQDNLQPIPLHRYLGTAQDLLTSNDERHLAIAIAALTGRRHTEVISKGQFEQTNHPYLLHFQGQQKKPTGQDEEALAFDILTLVPAIQVLEAIEQFRTLPDIHQLEGVDSQDPRIRTLNTRIDREVKRLFQDTGIVPVLAGRKTVSIHRLRGVYGAIAIHFFCPPTKHAHRFLQHYLGHVLDQQQTAPNSTATSHYFHYRLVDEQGQPLEGQGVRLGSSGVRELPSVSVNEEPALPVEPVPQVTQAQLVPAQPDQTEVYQTEPTQLQLTNNTLSDTTSATAEPAIATSNTTKASERSPAKRQRSSLSIYSNERQRWLAVFAVVCPQANNQQEQTRALLQWVEARLADTTDREPATTEPSSEPVVNPQATPQPQAEKQETTQQPIQSTILQTVADQAKTLSWLTSRIEALETEIAQLRQRRDEAIATSTHTHTLQQELERLKAENRELKQAAARFEAARKALLGDSNPKPVPAPSPALRADSALDSNSGSSTKPVQSGHPYTTQTTQDANRYPQKDVHFVPDFFSPAQPHDQDQVQNQTQQNRVPEQVQDTTSPAITHVSVSATPRPVRSGGAKDRAKRIFDAICQWNRQHPQDTWALTVGLLEESFGINRKAAKEFVHSHQNLIKEHHAEIGVENQRGHNRGKDVTALKEFVLDRIQV